MAIIYEKVVAEDLNIGVGAVSVTNPSGGAAMTGSKINAATFLHNVYNIRTYGAVPDFNRTTWTGTDNSAAIQAAVDAALAAGGGIVYTPPGDYMHLTGIAINGIPKVHLVGAGKSRSNWWCRGTNQDALSVIANPTADVENIGFSIRHMSINGEHNSGHTTYSKRGLYMKWVHGATFDDVAFENHGREGVYLVGCYGNLFNDCLIRYNGLSGDYDGFYAETDGGSPAIACNLVRLINSSFQFNTRHGINFLAGDGLTIHGCSAEGNGYKHADKGSQAGYGMRIYGTYSVEISGACYFENNRSGDIALDGDGGGAEVSTCFFNGNNLSIPAIWLNAYHNTYIHGNVSDNHDKFITVNASPHGLRIGPNFVLDTAYFDISGAPATIEWDQVNIAGSPQVTPGCSKLSGPVLISSLTNTITPSAAVDIQSTTGAFFPPRMTTTQRDAMTQTEGAIIYNTTTSKLQVRVYAGWADLH